MQTRLAAVVLLLLPIAASGVTPRPAPTGTEAEIYAIHRQFGEVWNRHDAAALAALWTKTGDYTEPDGRTYVGREALEKQFAIEHASVFKDSRLHLVVERVRMLGRGTAIADGSYELFGARDPTGSEIGLRSGYFTTVLRRYDGVWKVDAARLMLPQVLIWREK
mgnify:CR=1 FL=1